MPEAQKPQRQEETKSSARFSSPRPFREWQPDQGQLLPQYAREVLGEGHLACFFVELVKVLDFSPILGAYTKECGQPPYHPVMMTLLLMYAYARGITSSREIERRCETDLAFRYLTGGERPDHDTVCAFRVRHLEAFRALFVDTPRVASQSGLKKVGHLSVDGTKMKANASKHKAMSYGRMDEAMKKLDEQVERLLAEAEELDAQEDERHGKGRRGDELPEEMKDPKKRAERLREAARQVEEEKKVALAVEKEKRRERIGQAKQELEERMKRKLLTKRGRKAYARRKVTAEPVIGQVKNTVLPRFSLRGLLKVQGEFSLACAVHNLKKMWKQGWELPSLAAQAA
nr:transposase [Cystobacter fuscus]